MRICVREFLESDRVALRMLFLAARAAAFSWSRLSAHKLEDFDAATAGETVLVAVSADSLLGFASIFTADSFLHNLFVHPRHQGKGVGKALLEHCEGYFTAAPTLKCVSANAAARRFYESQGWTVRGEAEGPDGPYLLMGRVSPKEFAEGVAVATQAIMRPKT